MEQTDKIFCYSSKIFGVIFGLLHTTFGCILFCILSYFYKNHVDDPGDRLKLVVFITTSVVDSISGIILIIGALTVNLKFYSYLLIFYLNFILQKNLFLIKFFMVCLVYGRLIYAIGLYYLMYLFSGGEFYSSGYLIPIMFLIIFTIPIFMMILDLYSKNKSKVVNPV